MDGTLWYTNNFLSHSFDVYILDSSWISTEKMPEPDWGILDGY